MSRPSSSDAPVGPVRKPRPDLYTMLLVVALLALIVGTVFLYIDWADYGPTPAGEPAVQTGLFWPTTPGVLESPPLLARDTRTPGPSV